MDGSVWVAAVVGIAVALQFWRLGAIERRLRNLTRLEAKVDALLAHSGVTFDPYREVPPGVEEALSGGQRILAIKRYREATGVGLKEAKEVVDRLRIQAS